MKILQWFFSKYRLVPQRYIMCASCCMCMAVSSMLAVCEKQAIFKMVIVQQAAAKRPYVPGSYSCPFKYIPEQYHNQHADFYWSNSKMMLVTQIRWFATMFTPLPAGLYADLYGGRSVLTLSLLLSGVIYTLLPIAIKADYIIFIFLVLLRTFCYGMFLPATISIVARCADPNEITTFVAFLISGLQLGLMVGDITSHQGFHWDSLLHLNSFVAFLTAGIWYCLSRSLPSHTHAASDDEGIIAQGDAQITLMQVLKSWSVAVLSLLFISKHLVSYVVQMLSYYLQNVLFFKIPGEDMMKTGLIFNLYKANFILCMMSSGLLSDYLLTSRLLSLTTVRRLFVFLGSIVPVVLLIVASYAGCNSDIVTACLVSIAFFKYVATSNLYSTTIDFCPSFSGTITALVTVIASFFTLLTMRTLYYIFYGGYGEIEVWRSMYFVYGALIVISVSPYLLFPPTRKVWSPQRDLGTPNNSLSTTFMSSHRGASREQT